MKGFEQSGKDKEPRGMKEGSAKEEAYDRKQMAAASTKSKGSRVPSPPVGGYLQPRKN